MGLGTRTHIKAGHAALVLIENKTGNAFYYDFGRYITPEGKGRVRSALTDVELAIPFKALIKENRLQNLDEFLLWLDAHPEKTHGSGRLVASVCEDINYDLAHSYIHELQNQGSIPYRAFGKTGSNCARFVTETILASTQNKRVRRYLTKNKKFTPSTVGNVEKSSSDSVYQVYGGEIKPYDSSALRENLTNYFDKKVPEIYTVPPEPSAPPEGAQLLKGTGSSAYFKLEHLQEDQLLITRYTETGVQDFQGVAIAPRGFDVAREYQFVYDSNCAYCTVMQDGRAFRLELTKKGNFNSAQRAHSA